jgi:hypothetical protein
MIEEIRKLRESDVDDAVDLKPYGNDMAVRPDGSYELSTEQILKIVDDFGYEDSYDIEDLIGNTWIIEKNELSDKEDFPYMLVVNFEEWDRLTKEYTEEVLSIGSGREFVELK